VVPEIGLLLVQSHLARTRLALETAMLVDEVDSLAASATPSNVDKCYRLRLLIMSYILRLAMREFPHCSFFPRDNARASSRGNWVLDLPFITSTTAVFPILFSVPTAQQGNSKKRFAYNTELSIQLWNGKKLGTSGQYWLADSRFLVLVIFDLFLCQWDTASDRYTQNF